MTDLGSKAAQIIVRVGEKAKKLMELATHIPQSTHNHLQL